MEKQVRMSLITHSLRQPQVPVVTVLQNLSKLQAPTSNIQRNSKLQAPDISHNTLELVVWWFSGCWRLEFGALSVTNIQPKTILHTVTATTTLVKSAVKPASSACRVRFIATEPKYTAST